MTQQRVGIVRGLDATDVPRLQGPRTAGESMTYRRGGDRDVQAVTKTEQGTALLHEVRASVSLGR
jgi:hypothetical protein